MKAKPTIPEDDTMSARLQRAILAKISVPENLRRTRRERLHHFSSRFDSPFLFFIVDEKWSSILLCGAYYGRSFKPLSRQATPQQLLYRKNLVKSQSNKSKKAKSSKKKKHCLIC